MDDPITLLVVLGIGFALGYGVRELKSRKRRRRYAHLREGEVPGGAVHSSSK